MTTDLLDDAVRLDCVSRAERAIDVEDPVERLELEGIVAEAMRVLGERPLKFLRLYCGFDGEAMTVTEISRRVGLSSARVKQLIDRGLRDLRRALPKGLITTTSTPYCETHGCWRLARRHCKGGTLFCLTHFDRRAKKCTCWRCRRAIESAARAKREEEEWRRSVAKQRREQELDQQRRNEAADRFKSTMKKCSDEDVPDDAHVLLCQHLDWIVGAVAAHRAQTGSKKKVICLDEHETYRRCKGPRMFDHGKKKVPVEHVVICMACAKWPDPFELGKPFAVSRWSGGPVSFHEPESL